VAVVKAVITYPDGVSQINMSMTKVSCTNRYEYTQPYIQPGEYTYHIWAIDNSSQTNMSASYIFLVQEDTVAPNSCASLSGTWGENNWYVSDVTVSMCAYDTGMGVDYIEYMLNESPWLTYSAPFIVWEDDIHSLYYHAVDNADNSEFLNHKNIKIDQTKPTTICELTGIIGSQEWYISNVTIILDATDGTSGVNSTFYRLNNGDWQNYLQPFIVSTDTRHVLEFYSTDMAGNVELTQNITFKIDKLLPNATIITPRIGYLYIQDREIVPTITGNTVIIGHITIKVEASNHESGVNRVEFYIDNVLQAEDFESPYQWTWDYLSLGTHIVKATAYDNAGQYQSDEIIVKILNL
jgi:hypothetical protein